MNDAGTQGGTLTQPVAQRDHPLEPPGGVLVWMIVFIELVTFGAGLAVFAAQGQAHSDLFAGGRESLNQVLAFVNTLILLTGGWCMVKSLAALKRGASTGAFRWICATIGTGLLFTLLKGVEYADKMHHGLGFHRDEFYTLYYVLTGFHLIHVVVAVVILCAMAVGIHRGRYAQDEHLDVESSAIFWHMCDLIWLLVYPVVYLL